MKPYFKILLPILLIYTFNYSNCQDISTFYYQVGNGCDFEIIVLEPENYILLIDIDLTDDIFFSEILSVGKYEENEKGLLFHDDFYDFDIRLKREKEQLIVKKGFKLIKNISFKKAIMGISDSEAQSIIDNIDNTKDEIGLVDSLKCDVLTIGKFSNKNSVCFNNKEGCYLELERKGKYYQYEWGELFSRGRWKKDGSSLILYDKDLDTDYEVIIRFDGTLYATKMFPYTSGTVLSPR